MKPEKVNICGIEYSIEYCDNPSNVDIFKRKSLWGQCDYWTRTLRIYDNGQPIGEIWATIIHEVLHALEHSLNLQCFKDKDREETKDLDTLATALADTMIRNGWLDVNGRAYNAKPEEKKKANTKD